MARVEVNDVKEIETAAKTGGDEALFELGMIYCNGHEVDADLITAHKWFNLAALKGNEAAKEYRMELAREMTKSQIAEAQRQAREWLDTD